MNPIIGEAKTIGLATALEPKGVPQAGRGLRYPPDVLVRFFI